MLRALPARLLLSALEPMPGRGAPPLKARIGDASLSSGAAGVNRGACRGAAPGADHDRGTGFVAAAPEMEREMTQEKTLPIRFFRRPGMSRIGVGGGDADAGVRIFLKTSAVRCGKGLLELQAGLSVTAVSAEMPCCAGTSVVILTAASLKAARLGTTLSPSEETV